jgi:hypothetical protein
MKRTKVLPALLLGLVSVAASATANRTRPSFDATDGEAALYNHNYNRNHKPNPYNTLKIKQPQHGQQVTSNSIAAIFSVGKGLDLFTLRVRLNGKYIRTGDLRPERCDYKGCDVKVRLTPANGLRPGKNQLRAHIYGDDKRIELRRVSFDYTPGLRASGENVAQWLPTSVGLSVVSVGSVHWVTITTGTPSTLVDNIDQTTYSIPYADTTLPPADTTPCQTPYQVLVLNRWNPLDANLMSYQCASTQSDLANIFSNLTNKQLVIVSSIAIDDLPSGLNTTAIGGTDYSNASAGAYPQTYTIVGVPGASAGSAYESYATTTDRYAYTSFATGLLTQDENGNYNFHPGDNTPYSVTPGPVADNTTIVMGGQTYTAPASSQNGFWMLVVERLGLQPIDSSGNPDATCPYKAVKANTCGTFYPTGSTDSDTSSAAVADLASAMMNVNPRNLVFLTTVGQPFQAASAVTSALQQGFSRLGGVRYTLTQLTKSNSTYTLVAPGATSDRSPLDGTSVNSTSAYSQQKQTGAVSGVLARNLSSLYQSTVTAQTDGLQNGTNAVSATPDPSFYQITSQSPQHWPLTDTSGHIAAYHFVSGFFLQSHYPNMAPPYNQDIRYFYASSTFPVWQFNGDFAHCSDATPPASCPTYPGSGVSFTQGEMNDAVAQLYTELSAVAEANNFLGDNGMGGVIKGSSGGGNIALDMINASYTVLDGQFGTQDNTPLSVNASDWMNLVAGVLAIPAAALGPLDMPVVAAAAGVASGAFWTGSALGSIFENDPTTPPSYENQFDTTLGQLASGASSTYGPALTAAYDSSLDTIYADWGKLNAVYQKISNSGQTGWAFNTQLQPDQLSNLLTTGVRRSLYLQLLPQFYQLDTYGGQPISDITKMGMLNMKWETEEQYLFQCFQSYSGKTNSSYGVGIYLTPSANHDIFVIGGNIYNQGQNDVSEDLPSASLLDTLFAPVPPDTTNPANYLNFPSDPFYSNNKATGGYLTYRAGPNQSAGQCYKPGCVTEGYSDNKFCIGP